MVFRRMFFVILLFDLRQVIFFVVLGLEYGVHELVLIVGHFVVSLLKATIYLPVIKKL